jgi:hypothetical protein
MKRLSQNLSSLLLLALFVLPVVTVGCSENRGYGYRYYDSTNNRYYDPYYNDYHYWTPGEQGYYNRYYVENQRQYRDLQRLNRDQQKQYWHWRHEQAEHHEHDRDHDRH